MSVTKFNKLLAVITALAVIMTAMVIPVQANETTKGDLRWDFIADTEGFEGESRCKIDGVSDGVMSVTSTRNDPIIRVKGVDIDPNEYRYLRFRMKNNTPSDYIEVFFWTEKNEAHKAVTGVATNSTEFIEYEIDLWSQTNPNITTNFKDYAKYVTLRFDPMNNVTTHTVEIDYISLSKYSKNDTLPEMVDSITIGEQTIEDMSVYGHDTYCEKGIYEDVFKTLSADDISIDFASGFENASANISIKESGKLKIVDITAVSGDTIRSYRTVCKGEKRKVYISLDSFEFFNRKLTFSGTVKDEKGNPAVRPVTVLAHKKGSEINSDIAYVGVVMSDSDGKFGKTLTMYDPETTPLMYEMEIVFDASGAAEPWCEYVNYINNTYVDNSVGSIKESTDGVMELIVSEETEEMYRDFGVWTELYSKQDDDVKDDINEIIEPYRDDLNSANVALIANGSILAVIEDDISVEELQKLVLEVNNKISAIEVNDKNFGERGADEQKWIADNVKDSNGSGCDSYEEFLEEVQKSMLLYDVNHATYMELPEILLNNTDLLGDDLDKLADEDDEDVIDAAMKKVVLAASKNEFTKVKNLVNAVDDAFDKDTDTNKKPSSGGGGGGGGKGGSLVTSGTATGQKPAEDKVEEPIIADRKVFADMDEYTWAEDAVEKLNEKNIVSGVGNGRFEPGRAVTREEFVKMVLGAFNLGTSTASVEFTDVQSGDWFCPYVARAVELGIVKGVSEDTFGTGMTITREDMATIVYRVMNSLGKDISGSGNTFVDDAEIADYAKDAVSGLSGAGIINGKGDNSFAPKAQATRAEAAVIIYRCMEV